MKELPKMYHSGINKELHNNEKVYSTMYEDNIKGKSVSDTFVRKNNNLSIEKKIMNIFNSPNYIYKIDVIIKTDTSTLNKRIVGKTRTDLITMDNEYIPISTIRDIYIQR